MSAPKIPVTKFPVTACATNPRKHGNQKFQISTFKVFVHPSMTNNKLTINDIGINIIPSVVENASGPPTPQPISIIFSENP